MRLSFRTFEWVVDVIIVVTAIALLWSALISHRFHGQDLQSSRPDVYLRVGTIMPSMGGPWTSDKPTLIMFLSTTCHWCTASAEFYRELLESNSNGKFRILAVLPQPTGEARSYAHSLGLWIPNSDIETADLAKLGVPITPVLVLVDAQHRVEDVWIGKLSPAKEKDVFHDVGIY